MPSVSDTVPFEVQVTDDQPVDRARVQVTSSWATTRTAPVDDRVRCTGTIRTGLSGMTRRWRPCELFVAQYTDAAGAGLPALAGEDEVVLEPAG